MNARADTLVFNDAAPVDDEGNAWRFAIGHNPYYAGALAGHRKGAHLSIFCKTVLAGSVAIASVVLAHGAPPETPAIPRAGDVQGEPWALHVIDNTSRGADGARLLDVNGDGLLDIATSWEEGGVVRVYLHPPAGKVRESWPVITVGNVAGPEDAVFGDFDGDGAIDVLTSTEDDDRTLYVHWAPKDKGQYVNSSAWTTTAIPSSHGHHWMFAAPAQIDGQNGLDFVAGAKNADAWIGWYQAPPNAREPDKWVWRPLQRVGWVMSIAWLDMNGDGHPDVVYSDRKGEQRGVWWLENPGPARALGAWTRHDVGGHDREVMFLDYGAIDRGSAPGFVVATLNGGILRFDAQQDTKTWTQTEIPLPLQSGTGKSVAIGDVDGDGRNDVVVSCENARGKHGVFWLSRGEREDWTVHAISGLPGTKYDLVQLLDVDGDDDLDVITTEEAENFGVIWYENPAKPSK